MVNYYRLPVNLADWDTDTQRIPKSDLARDLGVDANAVRVLIGRNQPLLVLLSGNESEIIPKSERDTIEKELETGMLNCVVSKTAFLQSHDLSVGSLDVLMSQSDELRIFRDIGGYMCGVHYEVKASSAVKALLEDHLKTQR